MTDSLDAELVCTADEEAMEEVKNAAVLESEDPVSARVANLLRVVSERTNLNDDAAGRIRAAVRERKRRGAQT